MTYSIDENIEKAETLPGSFYSDDQVFDKLKERAFINSWLWVADDSILPFDSYSSPLNLLEGFVDEPLVLVKDQKGDISCLSNVCTHRGNLLINQTGKTRNLTCLYHGRKFDLNGRFQSMPEFEDAIDFPRECDHLPKFNLDNIGPFLFVNLSGTGDFSNTKDEILKRVDFLPLDQFQFDETLSKDYLVNCHWALYCDNYLEGFHIPFVHKDLNQALDYGSYSTLLFDQMNLQIGYSSGGEEIFDLPNGHPDFGREVAAYYFWLFPNTMLNFYPWGLSVNVVKPLTRDKTKVSFLTYIYDESKLGKGAGALLDKVEREDEFVVEGVHKGLKSRYYKTGRFSPTREKGVHHFQRLLAQCLTG